MLKTLRIQNFSVFEDAEIRWAKGINIIVGENGTGKSQLMKLAYSLSWVSHMQQRSVRQTKDDLQKKIADKLLATCRPEYLGRLVSRKQGRNRCDIDIKFVSPAKSGFKFSFATNSRSEVRLETAPTAYIAEGPVFIPTREMLSIFPGFVSAYEDRYLEFDDTYYDIAKALNAPAKKKRTAEVQNLIEEFENLMRGYIRLESGHFYLHPFKTGQGRIEVHLVAEGMRKLAMLVYLLMNGALKNRGTLFWDEPETNLNPKLMVLVARALVALAKQGYQIVLATHSLFLLRELSINLSSDGESIQANFIGLSAGEELEEAKVSQAETAEGLDTLLLLDEDLKQSDRFLSLA